MRDMDVENNSRITPIPKTVRLGTVVNLETGR
jgi:hypothetical protein